MAEQIPHPTTSAEAPVGLAPDYESLLIRVNEQRMKLQGIFEVHSISVIIWNRETKIMEEMQDKLELLRQGQLSL